MAMAQRADADRVAADMRPPDFRKALKTMRQIKAKKEKIAGVNGEIAGIYATVEGHKVNKKAAKIFMALDSLELPEKNDILRSLQGLIDVAEWEKDVTDLADMADGTVVHLNFGGSGVEADIDLGEDDEVGEDEVLDADIRKPVEEDQNDRFLKRAREKLDKRPSGVDAIKNAKKHLGTEEPYTGDNSDLNPDTPGTQH